MSVKLKIMVGDVLDKGTRDERIIIGFEGEFVYFVRPPHAPMVRQWKVSDFQFKTLHRPAQIYPELHQEDSPELIQAEALIADIDTDLLTDPPQEIRDRYPRFFAWLKKRIAGATS